MREFEYGDSLESGTDDERYNAARQLWYGHSRHYAQDVLAYVASAPRNLKVILFHFDVEATLTSANIIQELTHGDYLWGAWLAGLRPSPEYVPLLLTALKTRIGDAREATIFALGKSRDERAFGPLLEILQSNSQASADHINAGFAAQALGDLGRLEAEAPLIQALYQQNHWLEAHACYALGKIGTVNAIERLEELVAAKRRAGGLNVRGAAQRAIEQIHAREP